MEFGFSCCSAGFCGISDEEYGNQQQLSLVLEVVGRWKNSRILIFPYKCLFFLKLWWKKGRKTWNVKEKNEEKNNRKTTFLCKGYDTPLLKNFNAHFCDPIRSVRIFREVEYSNINGGSQKVVHPKTVWQLCRVMKRFSSGVNFWRGSNKIDFGEPGADKHSESATHFIRTIMAWWNFVFNAFSPLCWSECSRNQFNTTKIANSQVQICQHSAFWPVLI